MKSEKNKILIVDDMSVNRIILAKIFQEEFEILQAENGNDAIEKIKQNDNKIAAILLDIIMPVMDGFGVLEYMNKHGYMKEIPVVLITGDNSDEMKLKGYDYGVSDIISKPFDIYIVSKRVHNLIELYMHKNKLEEIVKEQVEEINAKKNEIMELNYNIIDTLGTIVEFRNLESGNHIMRVRKFTSILAKKVEQEFPEYELNDETVSMISYASAMHDVGKIAIPDSILLKPGKLTPDEFQIMKSHSERGSEIIERITAVKDEKYLKCCYEIARSHHEKYDGKGYPDGLKGDEIPISAQIVSVADVFDALISNRVYKEAYSFDKAEKMILCGECGVFNPKLLKCFVEVKDELEQTAKK